MKIPLGVIWDAKSFVRWLDSMCSARIWGSHEPLKNSYCRWDRRQLNWLRRPWPNQEKIRPQQNKRRYRNHAKRLPSSRQRRSNTNNNQLEFNFPNKKETR